MKFKHLVFAIIALSSIQLNAQNDCVNSIDVCGNRSISLNVSGGGIQELSNSSWCFSRENNSLWLKITISTSGTLGFDLIPSSTDINEDYDFMIFGPNRPCNNLGNPIRCSSTNPAAKGASNNHTGMRSTSGDESEGPGIDGDSWVKWLNVVAGETYYVLIDRPIGNAAFSLNWTGTAALTKYSAGTDKSICVNGSVTMNATTSAGMTWLQLSSNPKPVTIASINNPSSTVSGFTKSGIYKFVWSSVGCEDTVEITVRDTSLTKFSKSICNGQSYNGHTTAGVYYDRLSNKNACDSTIELTLNILNSSSSSFIAQICKGQNYLFDGINRTSSGAYTQTLINKIGCDSIVTLNLSIVDSIVYKYQVAKCPNEPYFFNGQYRLLFGEYKDTFIAKGGCDSFVYVTLAPKQFNYTEMKIICNGDNYRGKTLSGNYQVILKSFYGCDSIFDFTLTVLPPVYRDTVTYYGCQILNYKSINYIKDTQVNETILNQLNCDSIYRHLRLVVRPAPKKLPDEKTDFCDTITINNRLYTSNFSYDLIIKAIDTPHCDSLITKIIYTKHNSAKLKITSSPNDSVFVKGETLLLTASSALFYKWSRGDTVNFIQEKVIEDKQYYLIGWNDSFCRDTVYFNLKAEDIVVLDLPKAFNPNSTYIENQFFKPNMIGNLRAIRFEIYNRLGEKVFGTNSTQSLGWDGTYKGEPQPLGVYTYLLEYNANRRKLVRNGELILTR